MSLPAVQRRGRILAAALTGLLLAMASSTAPAHGETPTTGDIVGWVRDAGRPVPGTSVEIVHGRGPTVGTTMRTDAAGRFRLTDVPPGSWYVQFTLPGGGLIQYYPDTTDSTAATTVTVTAGRTTTIFERVVPHGAIAGRIVTNHGAPASGTYVGLESDPRLPIRTTTDAHGRYRLDYVRAGTYYVYAFRSFGAPKQWVPRATVITEATPVTITVGGPVHVDERLLPLGSITGTYTGPQGPIFANVDANGSPFMREVSSADDGTYTMWLAPGAYTLHFDSIYDNQDQWATSTLVKADAEVFTVREDEVIHHDEHTVRAGTITGRLVDYAGAPFADPAEVIVHDPAGEPVAHTSTDDAGYWSLAVFPDTYTVEFSYHGRSQWAHGSTESGTADRIAVGSGTTVTVDESFRPNTFLVVFATLDGTRVDSFCATIGTGEEDRSCTGDGEAYFTDRYPGTYQVTVEVPGHPPAAAAVTVINDQTTSVTVPVTG